MLCNFTIYLGGGGGGRVQWLSCRVLNRGSKGCSFEWHNRVLPLFCPWARHFIHCFNDSTSSTQENPFRHDWKLVDWDVKNQNKQAKHSFFVLKLIFLIVLLGNTIRGKQFGSRSGMMLSALRRWQKLPRSLTLVLLSPDFWKRCRSRSAGFWQECRIHTVSPSWKYITCTQLECRLTG